MSAFNTERVLKVRHWNDTLFSFTTTRDPGLRFENGQFVMMGLHVDGRPLTRAYSIASANHEEHLEFFSIRCRTARLPPACSTCCRVMKCWSAASPPARC